MGSSFSCTPVRAGLGHLVSDEGGGLPRRSEEGEVVGGGGGRGRGGSAGRSAAVVRPAARDGRGTAGGGEGWGGRSPSAGPRALPPSPRSRDNRRDDDLGSSPAGPARVTGPARGWPRGAGVVASAHKEFRLKCVDCAVGLARCRTFRGVCSTRVTCASPPRGASPHASDADARAGWGRGPEATGSGGRFDSPRDGDESAVQNAA